MRIEKIDWKNIKKYRNSFLYSSSFKIRKISVSKYLIIWNFCNLAKYDKIIVFDFFFLLGLSSAVLQPPNFGISPLTNQSITLRQHEPVRRFACPVGFFRLKRFCYYLSAGTAPWREAYFHCKDRNATLAILDRNGKDKMLRKYLMGDQFSKSKLILPRMIVISFNFT